MGSGSPLSQLRVGAAPPEPGSGTHGPRSVEPDQQLRATDPMGPRKPQPAVCVSSGKRTLRCRLQASGSVAHTKPARKGLEPKWPKMKRNALLPLAAYEREFLWDVPQRIDTPLS